MPRQATSFETAFKIEACITLEESPGDSIAEVGAFHELDNQDLVIADRLLPRIRRYDARGGLLRAYGRFGDGPQEFRGIDGVAPFEGNRVAVVDVKLGRLLLLDSELAIDTLLRISPPPSGLIARLGGCHILGLWEGRGGRRFHKVCDGEVRWSAFAPPEEVVTQPYWGSVGRELLAASRDRWFAAHSLLYPIVEFDAEGRAVGPFGTPPPSYRRVPEVAAGTFTGPGAAESMARWTAEFTVMGTLAIVAERYLIVSHARLSSQPGSLFRPDEYAVDVYDLDTSSKVWEDVPIPAGARILGGGSHLYVLTGDPPGGWQVMRASLRPPPHG